MEETEIPEVGVDHAADHAREHAHEHAARAPWLRWLALSTAILAVLGAITSLISGKLANEALLLMQESALHQARASDHWSHYQAKGIKAVVLESQASTLEALHAPSGSLQHARSEGARELADQKELKAQADEEGKLEGEKMEESHVALEHHHFFAYAVTILQVSIGLAAMAAIVENKTVWIFALLTGGGGVVMVLLGFLKGWAS